MAAEAKRKAEKYIKNLEHAFATLKTSSSQDSVKRIVDLAKLYLEDAKYYYEKGAYITSIACSSYAEGLLDALKKLGYADFISPQKQEEKKVLVGGVFEIIHPGHIFFLKEASKQGKLYVIVARDETVKKLKGREPIIPEKQRLEVVKSIRYVYQAKLGRKDFNIKKTIEEVKPDLVILGPDQDQLKTLLKKLNIKYMQIDTRNHDYPLSSTTQIIRKILESRDKLPEQ
ncbi:MAG: DUF357 domain-containing protein [Thermoprotei archaeon]|nr:MAG: DUF357 domain-containing protein [Thermoprotei archaeon]